MQKKKPHYAWVVCFSAVALYFGLAGIGINLYSVYQPFIIKEFGFTNTQMSLTNTLRHAASLTALFLVLPFYRKFKLKTGLLLSLCLSLCGYVCFLLTKGFAGFALGMLFVGFSGSLGGMVPLSMLMNRWFKKEITLAISLCSAATGMSMLGLPTLLAHVAENHGIKSAFLIAISLMMFFGLVALIFMRSDPEDMGLRPFGADETETENKKSGRTHGGRQKIVPGGLKKSSLPLIFLLAVLVGIPNGPGWSSMSLLTKEAGYSTSVMALTVSCMGVSLLVGKLCFGVLAEKISLYRVTLLYASVLTLSNTLLVLAEKSIFFLYPGACLFGACLPIGSIGMVTWVQDWFPPEKRDRMKQRLQSVYVTGTLGFSLLPGILADAFPNGYQLFYAFMILCTACIVFLIWKIYRQGEWTDSDD